MRIGRPTPPVVLTAEERLTLEQWARRPTTAQGLAQRARLVLACASSKTNGEIALADIAKQYDQNTADFVRLQLEEHWR